MPSEKLPVRFRGVGNAVNAVTELVLTTAVLVRNSLGVVFLLVFLVVGASPVIRYGLLALVYRFLAAVAQRCLINGLWKYSVPWEKGALF